MSLSSIREFAHTMWVIFTTIVTLILIRPMRWFLSRQISVRTLTLIIAGLSIGLLLDGHILPRFDWWYTQRVTAIREHVAAQVRVIPDQDFEVAMQLIQAEALQVGAQGNSSQPLDVQREWFNRYFSEDFVPFMHSVELSLPSQARLNFRRQVSSSIPPRFLVRSLGSASLGQCKAEEHLIIISAPSCDSYEELRHGLSHELVHYFVQRCEASLDTKWLFEGLTEYLTVATSERLGWELPRVVWEDLISGEESSSGSFEDLEAQISHLGAEHRFYPVETCAVSVLLALDKEGELWKWYMTDGVRGSYEDILETCIMLLTHAGLERKEASQFVASFQSTGDNSFMDEWDVLVRAKGHLNSRRAKLVEDQKIGSLTGTGSAEILLEVARHFNEVVDRLKADGYKPLAREEWEEAKKEFHSASKRKTLPTLSEDVYIHYYTNVVLGVLEMKLYGNTDSSHAKKVYEDFRSNWGDDAPTTEQVVEWAYLMLRLDLIHVRQVQESDWLRIRLEASRLSDQKLVQEIEVLEEQAKALLAQHTKIHWQLIIALSNRGVDVPRLLQEHGTPKRFLQTVSVSSSENVSAH